MNKKESSKLKKTIKKDEVPLDRSQGKLIFNSYRDK